MVFFGIRFALYYLKKKEKTLYYKNEIKKNCYEKENDRLLS